MAVGGGCCGGGGGGGGWWLVVAAAAASAAAAAAAACAAASAAAAAGVAAVLVCVWVLRSIEVQPTFPPPFPPHSPGTPERSLVCEGGGEERGKKLVEPQWIVARRLLSAFTIPRFA